jgi:hypothetical protein
MMLMHRVRDSESYFMMKKDAEGVLGFLAIQKCNATIWMLPYGARGDA